LALLSGRGEPEAERAEQAGRETGAEPTILRSTWFMQNFSEEYMLDHVLAGGIRLPAGEVPTPFLNIDDLANTAVDALTDDRHVGALYELTGSRSPTFARAPAEIGAAAGREIRYTPVSLEQHAAELADHGVPREFAEFLTYLFEEVVDGRNADTTDGVRRARPRAAGLRRLRPHDRRHRRLERGAGARLTSRGLPCRLREDRISCSGLRSWRWACWPGSSTPTRSR
jgi:uncharacterized protein YbjT (DUF2867 family)